jgi:Asp-tRNA(Asn)/Glu-tRNA(Gln) amidotransferase C subunit
MAELLGIDLEPDEIEPVATQIERVAELVDRLPRLDDDALTMAPRFRP